MENQFIQPNGAHKAQLFSAWGLLIFWVFSFTVINPHVARAPYPNFDPLTESWVFVGVFLMMPATFYLLYKMCVRAWHENSNKAIWKRILFELLLVFTGSISPVIYFFWLYQWDGAPRMRTSP
jgi:hypothetical protein